MIFFKESLKKHTSSRNYASKALKQKTRFLMRRLSQTASNRGQKWGSWNERFFEKNKKRWDSHAKITFPIFFFSFFCLSSLSLPLPKKAKNVERGAKKDPPQEVEKVLFRTPFFSYFFALTLVDVEGAIFDLKNIRRTHRRARPSAAVFLFLLS